MRRHPLKIVGLIGSRLTGELSIFEHLIGSICQHYTPARGVIVEAANKGGDGGMRESDSVEIRRIETRAPAYEERFWIEYNMAIRRILREERPDIIVITEAGVMPAVLTSGIRPKQLVYFFEQSLAQQVGRSGAKHFDLNLMGDGMVSLIVTPEIDRARREFAKLGWADKSVVEFLQVSPKRVLVRQPGQVGGLDQSDSCRFIRIADLSIDAMTDYLLDLPDEYSIDLLGRCRTDEAHQMRERVSAEKREMHYLGNPPRSGKAEFWERYDFSIHMQRPTDIDALHACSADFFESIVSGVPVISAPHPQYSRIIDRYGCGFVMRDWSQAALQAAVDAARHARKSDVYAQLQDGCLAAVAEELNWDAQFKKLAPFLVQTAV